MCEGDGAFPRQPVQGGKDQSPAIAGQEGGKFIQRAGSGPSELMVDGRFDRLCQCQTVLPPDNQWVMKCVCLSRARLWFHG